MNDWLTEAAVSCPYCGERIVIVIDLSAGPQEYTEDCQVCCQPMVISFDVADDHMQNLRVWRGD